MHEQVHIKNEEYFSLNGSLQDGEKILFVCQNRTLRFKETLMMTNFRVIIHNPADQKGGMGTEKPTYTFRYEQILIVNTKNHFLYTDLEIGDILSHIVVKNLKKDDANKAVQKKNNMKQRRINATKIKPDTYQIPLIQQTHKHEYSSHNQYKHAYEHKQWQHKQPQTPILVQQVQEKTYEPEPQEVQTKNISKVVFCEYCGAKNDPDEMFCIKCGKELKQPFK